MGEFGEVVHEIGWFYGEGTWSGEGRGRRVAGKMLRRGKGRGMWFEEERFLKMWNRMYIYIRPSQDKKKKEEEKKQQKKP